MPRPAHSSPNVEMEPISRGTGSSNPSPSSGESIANLFELEDVGPRSTPPMSRAGSNEHVLEAVQRRLDEHPVDAKRSDQSTAETPCREGAVHIWKIDARGCRSSSSARSYKYFTLRNCKRTSLDYID